MILEAGFEGFLHVRAGKGGGFYRCCRNRLSFPFLQNALSPDARPDTAVPDEEVEEGEKLHRVDRRVWVPVSPVINKKLK